MRQIVSLVKDNAVHYALVDDESGQMVPFADLLIPDPDRFGLHESALLGTNLVQVLGLNGTKRPKARVLRVGDGPAVQQEQLELEAAPAPETPKRYESKTEKQRRWSRESYARKKAEREAAAAPAVAVTATASKGLSKKARAAPENKVQRFIHQDEVLAVINALAEGEYTTAKQIAQVISKEEVAPRWVVRTVENRLSMFQMRARDNGVPLPYRIETGKVGNFTRRFIYRLS